MEFDNADEKAKELGEAIKCAAESEIPSDDMKSQILKQHNLLPNDALSIKDLIVNNQHISSPIKEKMKQINEERALRIEAMAWSLLATGIDPKDITLVEDRYLGIESGVKFYFDIKDENGEDEEK